MTENITIAVLSLAGTIIGSFAGILVANKLVNYRIEQLEKKLDKYADNQDALKERLVKVEESSKSAHKRLDNLFEQLQITERKR
jgi:septation ring formation regulator EzrA